MYRLTVLLFLCFPLYPQYISFSSNRSGSDLYFLTNLRLKGSGQNIEQKAFVMREGVVQLVRERDVIPVTPETQCEPDFLNYERIEASESGTVGLVFLSAQGTGCLLQQSELLSRAGISVVNGRVGLSSQGRYAVAFEGTPRRSAPLSAFLLDLKTGTRQQISDPNDPPIYFSPYGETSLRVIADDGNVLLSRTQKGRTLIVAPDGSVRQLDLSDVIPLSLNASGKRVLYAVGTGGVGIYEVETGARRIVIPSVYSNRIWQWSDDGRLILYLGEQQEARLIDVETGVDRVVASDPKLIGTGTISGDGRIVYVSTLDGRILRVSVESGGTTELIGRTPWLAPMGRFFFLTPGFAPTLSGSGLSEVELQGQPPFQAFLGNLTMWIGERKVPVIELKPRSVRFLVPWDLAGESGHVLAEVPGERTPFDFPAIFARWTTPQPQTGAVYRQDWTQTYSGPVFTGEVIHVYATGLGPVSPEPAEGDRAPSSEPFARITKKLTCSNAEILYAGLSPGTVERVYQVDLRIGPTAGYQKFQCQLDGGQPFTFLTLNVIAPGA
jgi:uncharacterized protein (TIGR03437 family)